MYLNQEWMVAAGWHMLGKVLWNHITRHVTGGCVHDTKLDVWATKKFVVKRRAKDTAEKSFDTYLLQIAHIYLHACSHQAWSRNIPNLGHVLFLLVTVSSAGGIKRQQKDTALLPVSQLFLLYIPLVARACADTVFPVYAWHAYGLRTPPNFYQSLPCERMYPVVSKPQHDRQQKNITSPETRNLLYVPDMVPRRP